MPPTGVKSAKRARQYEHIKESAQKRGVGAKRAKEIAARTVNKQRREAGQTKTSSPTRKRTAKKGSAKKAGSTRKSTAARKRTAARKTTRKSASRGSAKKKR